jgi:hypothetical protein
LGVHLRFALLFAMVRSSIRRGKKHDPERPLGPSNPGAFTGTNPQGLLDPLLSRTVRVVWLFRCFPWGMEIKQAIDAMARITNEERQWPTIKYLDNMSGIKGRMGGKAQ